jgi:hypothetical protein
MTDEFTIDLHEPHVNQAKILKSKAKYRVVPCGRRFGKSEASKLAANIRLMKGQHVWFCSPTNKNSKRMFRQFVRLYKGFPDSMVQINKTDMRIDFLFNDAFIEFVSLHDPDNLRGEGLDFIVIDEAAFVSDHVWDEILLPMTIGIDGRPDGEALFISSTNGKNWFWRMYLLGLDENETDYESFHFTSYDNPLIKKETIDNIKRKTPSFIFDREYMAVFEEDGGSVFKNISGCLRRFENLESDILQIEEMEKIYVQSMLENTEKTYVFGIDWGQLNDYTVITVYCVDDNSLVEYSRINKVLWKNIRAEVIRLYKKWNPAFILGEENNAKANIEELQDEGLPIEGFKTTAKSKPEIIGALALAIENNEMSLPDDKTLRSELSAYAMNFTKAGNIQYSAPIGLHDDIVMSLAICYFTSKNVLLPEAYSIITL